MVNEQDPKTASLPKARMLAEPIIYSSAAEGEYRVKNMVHEIFEGTKFLINFLKKSEMLNLKDLQLDCKTLFSKIYILYVT